MEKYYTRACNFYYGATSKLKIKNKLALALHGDKDISFDYLELISRKFVKKIYFKDIKKLNKNLRKKVYSDIKKITKIKKFKKLNLSKKPLIMGILNLTPDSFSDGGKYIKKKNGINHAKKLISDGCDIIDIGGESTRPNSKTINKNIEWKRINPTISKLYRLKKFISLDTRKSSIMKKGFKYGINLINDVSGLDYDVNTIDFIKKYKIPFVINHIQGSPKNMQKNPKYKNVLLDIYDYFEKKISTIRKNGIKHNNILIDPGIGFGKNLKHNITLISKISIFHSLGFPILVGVSRKKFIKDISGANDSKERIGGTVSTVLFCILQGVQILRVHDVNEIKQSIKVFKSINND